MTPRWTGSGGVADSLVDHVGVCALAVGICCLLAIPGGLALGRRRRDADRGRGPAAWPAALLALLSWAGRVVPALALLAALAVLAGRIHLGHPTVVTVVVLVLCGLPPLLDATRRGVGAVDPAVRLVARGLGLSARQQLWRVELPLTTPALLGGLRRSALVVVAVATTAAVISGPGLGVLIVAGLRRHDDREALTGAAAVAVLALVVDLALAGLARVVGRHVPGGTSPRGASPR